MSLQRGATLQSRDDHPIPLLGQGHTVSAQPSLFGGAQ